MTTIVIAGECIAAEEKRFNQRYTRNNDETKIKQDCGGY